MSAHASRAPARSGFNIQRFLANAHATAACAWIFSSGVSTAAEGITFGILTALSIVRWRDVVERLRDPPIRAPLLCFAALMAWMFLACAWGGEGIPFGERRPHRAFLAALMLAGAGAPAWGLFASMAATGLWWTAVLASQHLGLGPPTWMLPKHVSQAFLGLDGLAAAGIGLASTARSFRRMVPGAVALALAIPGASLSASRTHLMAIIVTALFCSMLAAAIARSRRRLALAMVVTVAVVAALVPFTPVWTKARFKLQQASLPSDRAPGLVDLYRAAEPVRADLHRWTLARIGERPLLGHGSASWARDFRHSMQSEESDFGWSKKRRDSLREIGAAHSLLLETAYEFGVVGVALLVALAAALIACARGAEVNARLMAVIALITITAVAGIGELVLNSRAIAASLAVSFALVAAVPGKRGRQGDEQPLPPEEFLPR